MITFTKEQLATLRKIAQQATQGEWRAFISSDTGTYAVHTPGYERRDDIIKWPGFDGQKNAANNARHIAAFNPKVVLALLDVLDASPEVKPVAWKVTFTQVDQESNTFTAMYSDKAEVERWVRLHEIGDYRAEITPLYAAPPVLI
ncbi:ead/Ea22-like family protein [Escherichia coli]|nr:ead/Ea22-like family protein [Escherichia coli]